MDDKLKKDLELRKLNLQTPQSDLDLDGPDLFIFMGIDLSNQGAAGR